MKVLSCVGIVISLQLRDFAGALAFYFLQLHSAI